VNTLHLDPEWEFYREKKRPDFLVPYKRNIYDDEMKGAVVRVLEAASATQGEVADLPESEQRSFEKEFAYFCGRKYALMFGSALHALYMIFRLQGFSEGDEVIVAPNIEPADANVILEAGGKPVFVDADEETLNMDVTKIEEKITSRTKAIHPIHGHGHPTDMDPIMEIAEKNDLLVVEDATHATGCKYKGNRLPRGHVGVFGMVAKCLWLPATGSMVVTDDEELEERLRMLMSWPGRRAPAEVNDFKGKGIIHALKTISDDVSAAVGRVQLRHLDEYTQTQRKNARMYTELLKGLPLVLPKEKDYAEHCYLRYNTRTEKRDQLQQYLKKQGIDSRVLYRTPAHLYRYYRETYGYKVGDLPIAEKIKATEIALPEPTRSRTPWEIEYTSCKVKEFFAN